MKCYSVIAHRSLSGNDARLEKFIVTKFNNGEPRTKDNWQLPLVTLESSPYG